MGRSIAAARIRLKPVRARATPGDGVRVLVDRLWPRGVRKSDAAVDVWCKELAPSTELRQWFAHDPARWAEFRRRYAAEVRTRPEHLKWLRGLAREQPLTLVFAAHDPRRNNAVVLRALLLGRGPRPCKGFGDV